MVELMKVKDLNKYYERLKFGVTVSTMWSTLQTKSEYGSSRSERGYQTLATSMASIIADDLKLNSDLAEVLTMCKGSFFTIKGKEGKRCLFEYMKQHNMQMSEADLARNFIEYDLDKRGNVITPEFDKLLKELFDEAQEPHTPEVQLARLCNEEMEKIKKLERYSTINQSEFLYNLTKDVEEESAKAGKPTQSKKIEELLTTIPNDIETEKITDQEKEELFKIMDEFVEYAKGDKMDGIYEYIGCGDYSER